MATLNVVLEKNIYFPGEVVRGNLLVMSTRTIQCRAIRVQLQGKGHSRIVRGSGKHRKVHVHTKFYANSRKVVWGHLHSTSILMNSGTNAVFGPPWAPDEGVLHLPYDGSNNQIVIRVMDYDWGKKDDLLGEVVIDVNQCVDRGGMEMPLTRNGKPEKGIVSFTLSWEPNLLHYHQGARTLRLQVFTATNLRSAEWFGKNDVYVQAYYLPPPKAAGGLSGLLGLGSKGLPPPPEAIDFPAANLTIPFEFLLPSNLPSTFISGDNYITYSVYANIDIAWKMDPSCRAFFTVIQPHVVASMMTPQRSLQNHNIYPRLMLPPFCCFSCPLPCFTSTELKMDVSIDRSAYAPGETIQLVIDLVGEASNRISSFKATLRQIVQTYAHGHFDTRVNESVIMTNNSGQLSRLTQLVVPPLAPTYQGGLGQDPDWSRKLAQFGMAEQQFVRDPVTWSYNIVVCISVKDTGYSCLSTTYTTTLPVVLAGIGLQQLPAYHDTAYWEAQERLAAPISPVSPMIMTTSTPLPGGTAPPFPSSSSASSVSPVANVVYSPSGASAPPAYNYNNNNYNDGGYGNDGNIVQAVAIVDWHTVPQIQSVLPTMVQSTAVSPAVGGGALIYNEEEDYTANKSGLTHTPTYFMSK